MNLKNLKYFKKGIQELTPLQLSQGRIAGLIGMIIGLILATINMVIQKNWGFTIFLTFLAWLQLMGLLGELKQYTGLKEMMQQVEEAQNTDLNAFIDPDIKKLMECEDEKGDTKKDK